MKNASCLVPLCMLFGLIATKMHAQDLNDEMKKRLRQSIIIPEKKTDRQQFQQLPQIQFQEEKEVLKVSPFTKLPTKADRIKSLFPPEDYKIHIDLNVTNAPPINERPVGSVKYEFVGKNLQIIPTGGQRVVPSGMDSGPIRKRHKKNANILKALQK